MTQILTYSEIDRQQWSELVQMSEKGTWFQTPEAYDFFASLPEVMEPFAIGIERVRELGNERVRELAGVCVGYVTKERNPIMQFFTRRAIVNGGPVLAADCTEEEVTLLLATLHSKLSAKSIYIETRNFNDYSPWKEAFEKAGYAYHQHLNFHIDCSSHEQIDTQMSNVRKRQVRKAKQSGAVIAEASTEQEVREWYDILAPLYRQKVKTPLFPLSFFLEFFRGGVGKYLLVKHEGMVIGGVMCPIMPDRCIYEWFICGLDTPYHDQYPSVMATYAAMDYAVSHQLKRFDVMGAGKPGVPYGVRDFKAEFGGALVEHGRFLCVCKPMLYRIGTWGVKLLKGK